MDDLWEHNGIKARGAKPALVGAYDHLRPGGCIVLGTSRKAWTDLDEALELFKSERDYDIIAINDIAHQMRRPIAHIVSLHKEILGPLRQIRQVKMQDMEHVHTHGHRPYEGVDFVWGSIATSGGTSGLFAVKAAVAMGYSKIVVAGVGIDKTGHYYDPEDHNGNGAGVFDEACREPWKDLWRDNPEFKKRVRILSGSLMDLYGRPTQEWVYS